MPRVFPLTQEAHALIRIARTRQPLYIRVKAAHENVVPFFFVEFCGLGPKTGGPLLGSFLGFGLNFLVLGVDLEGEFHVLYGVFVAVEHFGVAGQDVSGDLHGGCHILRTTFQESTATPRENGIPREHTPIDRSSHLITLCNFVC